MSGVFRKIDLLTQQRNTKVLASRRKDESRHITRAFTIRTHAGHLFVNHLSAGASRTPGPVTPRGRY